MTYEEETTPGFADEDYGPETEIEIVVKKGNEVIGRKTALSWESAEENLGKLQRQFN